MAFLRKAGGILGRTLNQGTSMSNPSLLQAVRWMSSSKVFVGGLSYDTDETGLREAFGNYGHIADVRLIIDRETNRSRGFGFVTYSSPEEASAAIQALDQQNLHGRTIKVNYATDRQRGGGGYGGGGYGGGGGGYGGGGYGGGSYGGGESQTGGSGGYGGYGGGSYGNGAAAGGVSQTGGSGSYGGGAPAGGESQTGGGSYGNYVSNNSYGGGGNASYGGDGQHYGGAAGSYGSGTGNGGLVNDIDGGAGKGSYGDDDFPDNFADKRS